MTYQPMTDAEYAAARAQRWSDQAEFAEVWAMRTDQRQCMVCGQDSGDSPELPPGWSFDAWSQTAPTELRGMIASFYCERCAKELDRPERMNYGEDRN